MALLRAEIAKLQLNHLVSGVAEEIISTDDVFNYVPFFNISPLNVFQYTREGTLGTESTGSFIAPTGTISESSPTFNSYNENVRVILETVNIPRLALGDSNVLVNALAAKSKAVSRAFSKALIQGSGVADSEFKGFETLVSGSATDIDVSGSLTLAKMDELIDATKAGMPSFIVGSKKQVRALKALYRAAGGIVPGSFASPNVGVGAFAFEGVPVIKSDWCADANMYAVYASQVGGFTAFYNGSGILEVSQPIEVVNSDMVQFKITMRVGTALQSSLAIAKLSRLA